MMRSWRYALRMEILIEIFACDGRTGTPHADRVRQQYIVRDPCRAHEWRSKEAAGADAAGSQSTQGETTWMPLGDSLVFLRHPIASLQPWTTLGVSTSIPSPLLCQRFPLIVCWCSGGVGDTIMMFLRTTAGSPKLLYSADANL
jgi:hypothetical protein